MKSRVFFGSIQSNKKLAAEYVARFLSETGTAQLVFNESTGGSIEMSVGVRSEKLGLVHVTCGSSTDPNERIWGWSPSHLALCGNIEHVAFVWSDRSGRVLIAVLSKEKVVSLGSDNDGNYSKNELRENVIPDGIKVVMADDLLKN